MVNDFLPRPHLAPRPTSKHSQAPEPESEALEAEPFKTPEQVAAEDEYTKETDSSPDTDEADTIHTDKSGNVPPPTKPKRNPWKSLQAWFHGLSRKQIIILGIVAALVLAGLCAGAYALFHHAPAAPKKATVVKIVPKVIVPPKPTTVASTLTGLQVDPAVNQRPVTGVMIENSPDARPQSGLNQAGVVFEAIAEGGITRFLTLFQDTQPDYIGPVRSVRPYYIQWAAAFNAGIAHVGGSGEALQDMKDWGIRDLDQFAGAAYFTRITQRYAPHNVYTSIAKLNEYETSKGYHATPYSGFARRAAEAKPSATPTAKTIDFALSGYYYNAHYDYDAATNTYKRSEGGAPHTDEKSGVQLAPKVVIALVMPYSLEADHIHSVYETIGSGHVYIFQDGVVTEGTWHKDSREKQFSFTDADAKPILLNPGQTWLTALGGTNQVTYAP